MATKIETKSQVRVIVVSDDIDQTEKNCPDFAFVKKSAKELVQFGTKDVKSINGTFPLITAHAFLGKLNGEEDEGSTPIGIVDFSNIKVPEFAKFMYGYLLAQGIYCYALGLDESQVKGIRIYVQSMCAEYEAYSETWKKAVATIELGEPLAYLLCGILAARFDSQIKTVIYTGDTPKHIDLFICAILSSYDPLVWNPVIAKGKNDFRTVTNINDLLEVDEDDDVIPETLVKTVIFSL